MDGKRRRKAEQNSGYRASALDSHGWKWYVSSMRNRRPFTLPKYSDLEKSFVIEGPLPLEIDNDDVPAEQVKVLAKHLVAILNQHWTDPVAFMCDNEDCDYYRRACSCAGVGPNDEDVCLTCNQPLDLETISL